MINKIVILYAIGHESDGEKISKIGQHFAKLWATINCAVFWTHWA